MIERKHVLPGGIGYRIIKHQDVLYCSGFVADDFALDMAGQTEQTITKMRRILESVGSSLDKVLTATIYLSDFSKKSEMSKVWTYRFGSDVLPARSTIGVSDLGKGVLLEIVVTAAA